ncbi:MAG: sulfatase [Planctomycetota bacterium]
MKEAGYITAGLTDGGYLHPLLGFGQGFDTYHCLYENISEKVDRAISWLEQNQRAERPFFLFLHTYEVHEPYLPPEPFRNRFAPDYEGWVKEYCFGEKAPVRKNIHAFSELFKQRSNFGAAEIEYLSGLYDGEIAYTDQELGRLWNHLAKAGLWDNLTLIVFSDHGEEFGEHGEFGHKQLFDEVLRVPLLWILPPGRGRVSSRRVAAQVSLIDVMPTLLDFLEIPAPAYLQGRSLRPLWEGDGQEGFPSFSEYIGFEPDPLVSSIRYEGRKLISYSDKHRLALYDLGTDCEETADRSHEEEGEARKLHRMLGKWHERNIEYRKVFKARVQDIEIDSKLYEELKALGY